MPAATAAPWHCVVHRAPAAAWRLWQARLVVCAGLCALAGLEGLAPLARRL